ncbi:MAG TPA: hypothetical protein VFQ38_13230 [Longimicrobiales bacterium]|nr:hypothetical protein [Longimicrobiales bacterium]
MARGRSARSPAPARSEAPAVAPGHTAAHGRPFAIAPVDIALARWFYCDVLRGRQVWPSERTAGRALCFEVGDALVAVRPDDRDVLTPVVLVVDDPVELAERCWDAGFTVQVGEPASGRVTVALTDPFGQRLVAVPRTTARVAGFTEAGR